MSVFAVRGAVEKEDAIFQKPVRTSISVKTVAGKDVLSVGGDRTGVQNIRPSMHAPMPQQKPSWRTENG